MLPEVHGTLPDTAAAVFLELRCHIYLSALNNKYYTRCGLPHTLLDEQSPF